MMAGGQDTSVKQRRLVQRASPQLGGAEEPYALRRGDCARAPRCRDEWALMLADPSVLHFMSRRTLTQKLLEAAKLLTTKGITP